MTHREFYYWMEGYLHGKENMSYDQIALFMIDVKNKMKEVREIDTFFPGSKEESHSHIKQEINLKK